ncbi:MAG: ABC transporter substrate-binding protein [Planctomycetes bacterium]|nr:ABC transporter substrate-binding protein [Planctomycetota bacterium]
MKNHPLIAVTVAALLAIGAGVAISFAFSGPEQAPPSEATTVVSLSPPITETLFEIGAGGLVIGRSDYCQFPPQVADLPPCGTALSPNGEAIVRLSPGLIIADASVSTPRDEISKLGKAAFMPWLTAEDIISSTRELGRLTNHIEEANKLADDLAAALQRRASADAPRVLLVMTPTPGKLGPITFFRRNSIHGRMLEAAGGRNAADYDETGVPIMPAEKVLQLDPDVIIVIDLDDDLPENRKQQILHDWSTLAPLTAVQQGRVGVLNGQHFYGAGRRLIRAVDELRAEIQRLRKP